MTVGPITDEGDVHSIIDIIHLKVYNIYDSISTNSTTRKEINKKTIVGSLGCS